MPCNITDLCATWKLCLANRSFLDMSSSLPSHKLAKFTCCRRCQHFRSLKFPWPKIFTWFISSWENNPKVYKNLWSPKRSTRVFGWDHRTSPTVPSCRVSNEGQWRLIIFGTLRAPANITALTSWPPKKLTTYDSYHLEKVKSGNLIIIDPTESM